jgi:hypothetical protein
LSCAKYSLEIPLHREGETPSTSKKCRSQTQSPINFGIKPLETMNDQKKYTLIQTRLPLQACKFPAKAHSDRKKKSGVKLRSCQHQWFQQYHFIFYSTKDDGLFFLACNFFPKG